MKGDKSKMALKITTQKIVERGVKKRKITKIEGLITGNKLPIKYHNQIPYLYTYYEIPHIKFHSNSGTIREIIINVGRIYKPEEWDEEILPAIKEAGQRLHEIRKEVKEIEKEWQGEETFIV